MAKENLIKEINNIATESKTLGDVTVIIINLETESLKENENEKLKLLSKLSSKNRKLSKEANSGSGQSKITYLRK